MKWVAEEGIQRQTQEGSRAAPTDDSTHPLYSRVSVKWRATYTENAHFVDTIGHLSDPPLMRELQISGNFLSFRHLSKNLRFGAFGACHLSEKEHIWRAFGAGHLIEKPCGLSKLPIGHLTDPPRNQKSTVHCW